MDISNRSDLRKAARRGLLFRISRVYPEIDMVTTPTGKPVAMVHCNTCTSDLDAWVKLFSELLTAAGASISKPALYDLLYYRALESEPDAGGVVSYMGQVIKVK